MAAASTCRVRTRHPRPSEHDEQAAVVRWSRLASGQVPALRRGAEEGIETLSEYLGAGGIPGGVQVADAGSAPARRGERCVSRRRASGRI